MSEKACVGPASRDIPGDAPFALTVDGEVPRRLLGVESAKSRPYLNQVGCHAVNLCVNTQGRP
jgi:hypothetical protein